MTFQDIFKSSFVENVEAISVLDMALAMLLAFGVGLFIFFIYKKTYAGVMYSSGFGVTLIALTMITTLVILAVTSNVVLSLGMVGALSIVRFRTAIKEPMDIAFLFWAIAVGIVLAAGMIPLAVFGSCDGQKSEQKAREYLVKHTKRCSIKSKTAQKGRIELTCEVRLRESDTDFINEMSEMDGVESAVLVSYNGDYMS